MSAKLVKASPSYTKKVGQNIPNLLLVKNGRITIFKKTLSLENVR